MTDLMLFKPHTLRVNVASKAKIHLVPRLRIAGSSVTSLWRREAALKKSVKYINIISCFVTTIKLPHTLQIYSTVFMKKCMQLHLSR